MKPYPPCRKCGKGPLVHGLIGMRLACTWGGGKVLQEGDFGRATPLVVADVYKSLGRKTPHSLVSAVLRLRKEGITTWEH